MAGCAERPNGPAGPLIALIDSSRRGWTVEFLWGGGLWSHLGSRTDAGDISSVTVHVFTVAVDIRDGGHETPPLHVQLPVRALQMLLSRTLILGVAWGGLLA